MLVQFHFHCILLEVRLELVPSPQEATGHVCVRVSGRCACRVSAVKAVRGPRGKALIPSGTTSWASVLSAAGFTTRVRANGNQPPDTGSTAQYTLIHECILIERTCLFAYRISHTVWTVIVCFISFYGSWICTSVGAFESTWIHSATCLSISCLKLSAVYLFSFISKTIKQECTDRSVITRNAEVCVCIQYISLQMYSHGQKYWHFCQIMHNFSQKNVAVTNVLVFTCFGKYNWVQSLPVTINEFLTPLYWNFGPLFLPTAPGVSDLKGAFSQLLFWDLSTGVLWDLDLDSLLATSELSALS